MRRLPIDRPVVVRACRASEIAGVLELWRASRDGVGRTDDPLSLQSLLDRDQGALLVAELEGRIVGSLIAAWDGWRGNMYRLTVHPDYRRRGVARRLIAKGEDSLRAAGATRISALVWTEDEAAVSAWLSTGYAHDEGTGRFVKTAPFS